MNREILYRGKAINRDTGHHRTAYKNGDWVYGLVTRLYDERYENLPAEMTNIDGVSGIEVDYKTIGRYTGLKDKNGRKIFEGDIIKGKGKNAYAVKYSENIAGFITDGLGVLSCPCVNVGTMKFYEVIGNIYDNPELMGGKEND